MPLRAGNSVNDIRVQVYAGKVKSSEIVSAVLQYHRSADRLRPWYW